MVGSSHETTNQLLVEAYGVTFPYAIFDAQCRALMHERMAEAVPVKAGVHEMLGRTARRGGIPMAVATSSRAPHALSHLGTAGLLDMFPGDRHPRRRGQSQAAPGALSHGRAAASGVRPEQLPCGRGFPFRACAPRMRRACRPSWCPTWCSRPTRSSRLCAAVMESLHHLREAAFRRPAEAPDSRRRPQRRRRRAAPGNDSHLN